MNSKMLIVDLTIKDGFSVGEILPIGVPSENMCNAKHGFTLIETLVSVGILSILLGITMVGIGAMRERSRKVHCQNNLRQLGLGLLNFEGARNHLPPARVPIDDPDDVLSETTGGAFVALVPFLEIPAAMVLDEAQMPMLFQCPSSHDGLSYRINVGPLRFDPSEGRFYDGNGIVNHTRDSVVKMSSVSDGLSNTVAVSERVNTGSVIRVPNAVFVTRRYHDMLSMQFSCLNEAGGQVGAPTLPELWTTWSTQRFGYDHWSPPNSDFLDCQGMNSRLFLAQLVASRSRHRGGVFSVKLDGSVIWSADSIDTLVWRSLGTRSNDEGRWEGW